MQLAAAAGVDSVVLVRQVLSGCKFQFHTRQHLEQQTDPLLTGSNDCMLSFPQISRWRKEIYCGDRFARCNNVKRSNSNYTPCLRKRQNTVRFTNFSAAPSMAYPPQCMAHAQYMAHSRQMPACQTNFYSILWPHAPNQNKTTKLYCKTKSVLPFLVEGGVVRV